MLKALFIWGSAYGGMFLAKWSLVAVFLGKESIADSFMRSGEHMKGTALGAVYQNITAIFPVGRQTAEGVKVAYLCTFLGVGIVVLFMLLKTKENTWKICLIILMLLPYIRYAFISEHAMQHYFFTYRAQLVTIMIFCEVLIEGIRGNRGK